MVQRRMVQVLHSPQKFERPSIWNGWSDGTKNYGAEVVFSGVTSLLNLIRIYEFIQKLSQDTHTDRQTDRMKTSQASVSFLGKAGQE
jgi:hypothetical protein